MASKDFDGSVIVILSKDEALAIYERLRLSNHLTEIEQHIICKITRDLELDRLKPVYRGHQYDVLDSKGLSGGKE